MEDTMTQTKLPGKKPPRYELADVLRARMSKRQIKAGDKMPSLSTLGREFGLATNTVRAALDLLRQDGMETESWPGYGNVVTKLPGKNQRAAA